MYFISLLHFYVSSCSVTTWYIIKFVHFIKDIMLVSYTYPYPLTQFILVIDVLSHLTLP